MQRQYSSYVASADSEWARKKRENGALVNLTGGNFSGKNLSVYNHTHIHIMSPLTDRISKHIVTYMEISVQNYFHKWLNRNKYFLIKIRINHILCIKYYSLFINSLFYYFIDSLLNILQCGHCTYKDIGAPFLPTKTDLRSKVIHTKI